MVTEGVKYIIIQIKQCNGSMEICKDQLNDTQQTMACRMRKLPYATDERITHVERCASFLHTESIFLEVC